MTGSGDEEALALAREQAVRLLARREHSAAELERKLRQRGFVPAMAQRAVATLATDNLQSDRRYAEAYVRNRRERGFGPIRIRAELGDRGVAGADVEAALAAEAADYGVEAQAVRAKRFGVRAPTDRRDRDRQYRFLAGRGFDAEHIRAALERAGAGDEE